MKDYLAASIYIDWQNPALMALAASLAQGQSTELGVAKACFEYVRDEIQHSWDFRHTRVTVKASDVLRYGTGFCYAKSHLLAALLRANAIPAGLCYQRLTITDQPPFCTHGLNAVYLNGLGWYRVDARGNKNGVNARFTPPVECLAFALVQPGEMDIAGIFAEPHPAIIALLESCDSVQTVFARLIESDFTTFMG
jgi:transglutaminase-like putative cysteine protease